MQSTQARLHQAPQRAQSAPGHGCRDGTGVRRVDDAQGYDLGQCTAGVAGTNPGRGADGSGYRRWCLRHKSGPCDHSRARRAGGHTSRGRRRALASQARAPERNKSIEQIARSGKQDWKEKSGYHHRSLVENLMCWFKTVTGDRLWARDVDVQDEEVADRVGVLNRVLVLARPKSVFRMA